MADSLTVYITRCAITKVHYELFEYVLKGIVDHVNDFDLQKIIIITDKVKEFDKSFVEEGDKLYKQGNIIEFIERDYNLIPEWNALYTL